MHAQTPEHSQFTAYPADGATDYHQTNVIYLLMNNHMAHNAGETTNELMLPTGIKALIS